MFLSIKGNQFSISGSFKNFCLDQITTLFAEQLGLILDILTKDNIFSTQMSALTG